MSATIIRLMSSETIIGELIGKDAKNGTLFIQNPVLLETVIANNSRYVMMRDMLKDSSETIMPINGMNVMYSYPAAPQVEAYYKGCIPEFEKAKVEHLAMYDELLKGLVEESLEENQFEVPDGMMLQPSSKTAN